VSRRSPAWRVLGSGPWQWKQLSDRSGSTSRAKSTFSAADSEPAMATKAASVSRNEGTVAFMAAGGVEVRVGRRASVYGKGRAGVESTPAVAPGGVAG